MVSSHVDELCLTCDWYYFGSFELPLPVSFPVHFIAFWSWPIVRHISLDIPIVVSSGRANPRCQTLHFMPAKTNPCQNRNTPSNLEHHKLFKGYVRYVKQGHGYAHEQLRSGVFVLGFVLLCHMSVQSACHACFWNVRGKRSTGLILWFKAVAVLNSRKCKKNFFFGCSTCNEL